MGTILFDKMLAARKLEGDGKFSREQAETISEVFHDAMTEATATKADLQILKSELLGAFWKGNLAIALWTTTWTTGLVVAAFHFLK